MLPFNFVFITLARITAEVPYPCRSVGIVELRSLLLFLFVFCVISVAAVWHTNKDYHK